jgi:hypothetical protein
MRKTFIFYGEKKGVISSSLFEQLFAAGTSCSYDLEM